MQCPRCKYQTPSDAEFCPECGENVAVICKRCSTSNAPAHKFCKHCGNDLTATAGGVSARFRAPEFYTPKYLAEKIRTASVLGDERKQVTVLFADIKGSLELIADQDPEDASKILDGALQLMIKATHRYEGTVNRVMGDGIMALFGAPAALENHAARACYAALLMQESITRFSEEIRSTAGVYIQVRIGVNSGEVIVRSIQSDLQIDYAAVGQTTHLAARMEQIATPGSILITAEVKSLTQGYIDVKPLGPVPVKGMRKPVEVFEVIGAGAVRTRIEVAASRGLTRFVGRTFEMEALRNALKAAHSGQAQVVGFFGEAGVGKSRLLYEFIHSNDVGGWLLLESSSVSYERAAPYLPIVELLRNYFKIHTHDDVRTVREKIAGKIVMLDHSLQETIPAILHILDALSDDHVFHDLQPLERREHTVQAIKRIILSESRIQPVLLVFEDLQWDDSSTLAVLDGVIEGLRTSRVLILISHRPTRQHTWANRSYYTQYRLEPLARQSLEELLQALLGADPSLAALKELLILRTEGNPFFVEEIVRTLVETKILTGEVGRRQLTTSVSTIEVPPTVQDVIASRIDRLPPQEKRLLHEASVIGKDVQFTLLHMVTALPEEQLRGCLDNLQAAEFLHETRLYPDIEYTFNHALIYQVAYVELLHEHRREMHARILECMETLYADRLSEQVERLASHALYGELWPKALKYLRQAGAKAMNRPANRHAVMQFEQALNVLKHLPQDRETLEQAIDLRFDIRNALQPLGERARILECLQEADSLAARIDDQRRLGWVASYLTEHFRMLGDSNSAMEAGKRALAIARQLSDLPLNVVTNLPMGLLCHALGEYRQAIEFFQWNLNHLEGELLRERFGLFGLPAVHSRTFLVWCLAEIGEFEEGRIIGEQGIGFAKAMDQPFELMYAYLGIGVLHLRRGDLQQAIFVLERALELSEFAPVPVGFSYGASYLGYCLALEGRASEALPLLEKTTSPPISTTFVARHSLRMVYLGEAYLLAGRVGDGAEAATQALELARKHRERGHEGYAERLLGEVATKSGQLAQAEAHYRNALCLAHELGMRPLAAHCHWGLARVSHLARGQDPTAVKQDVSAARMLFGDMGMVGWLQRMEAEFGETIAEKYCL